MLEPVDTRAWNLLAGLTLVTSACSGRTVGSTSDGSGTGSSDETSASSSTDTSTSTTATAATSTETSGECVENSDCPLGYYCLDGVCEYAQPPDGGPLYECVDVEDCEGSALCIDGYCEDVPNVPNCAEQLLSDDLLFGNELPDDARLALSFANVDNDVADEVVVVTETELHTLEFGGAVTSTPRTNETSSVDFLVSGALDDAPGDDLIVLLEDQLIAYSGDGAGGWGAGVELPPPLQSTLHLRAGDFDAQPPEDLLFWGEEGAVLQLGAQQIPLTDKPSRPFWGTAREVDSDAPGLALRWPDNEMGVFDLDGSPGLTITVDPVPGSDPFGGGVTSGRFDGLTVDITASNYGSWSLIQYWRPDTGENVLSYAFKDPVVELIAADFDGVGDDELILRSPDDFAIVWFPFGERCYTVYDIEVDWDLVGIAVGDFDGDFDQDLALDNAAGELGIWDMNEP